MTDAKNTGRVDVWPSYGAAAAAQEDGGKLLNRMTVWPTTAEAKAHKHHGGGGYVGPLDIVPGAVVAYSQRAMSAALRGSPLYTIADGAGGATQSFNSDATTGDAPSAAILSYSATPFVELWKDQSGNTNDVAQTVGAHQPAWVANAQGGKPELKFVASAPSGLSNPAVSWPLGGVTTIVVAKATASTAPTFWGLSPSDFVNELFAGVFTTNGGGFVFGKYTGTTFVAPGAVSNGWGSNDGSYHILGGTIDGTIGKIYFDGVEKTLQSSPLLGVFGGATLPFYVGDDAPASSPDFPLDGGMLELVNWPFAIDAPTLATIFQNIATAFGITLS